MQYIQTYENFTYDDSLNEGLIDGFKGIINKLKKSVGVQLFFAFTFGTSIEALYSLFMTYIKTTEITSLGTMEIGLLFVCALTAFLKESKSDLKKLYDEIKKNGIVKHLRTTIDFFKTVFTVIKTVFKNLGKSALYLTELLGYIGLFAPVVYILRDIMTTNAGVYPGAITSVAIGLGALTTKAIIEEVMEKLEKKKLI